LPIKKERKVGMRYRIDAFIGGKKTVTVFDNRGEAVSFGKKEATKGKIVFLLAEVIEGLYDVEEQIEEGD